jgi:phage terminase large subunit-like protein
VAKDSDRVKRIIQFIEQLTIPSGVGEGEPFKLRRFQRRFITDVYGPVNQAGNRRVRRAILAMARKNGKSVLIAALALVHLVGPEAITNGEIYSAATEREQAALIFKYAAQIVRADPELESIIKITDSTKTMVCFQNGSIYRALSAEAGSKYGLNPTVVIYDELAQAKNRDLYDALDTSMAARLEPLFVVISTQSNDPQHILSQLIDDGLSGRDPSTVCHLYAVPDDAEGVFEDEKLWRLANPALGDFRSLSEMKTAAKRAKRMPSFESAFRNLYLNQRVDAKSPFIPRAEWASCQGDATIEPGSEIYLGLDLSGKTDLTALIGISNGEQDRVKSWFWKPKESLLEHEKRDRVPYPVWERQGFIKTTPGRAIQYSFIAQELAEIHKTYTIIGMAFDRYRIDDLRTAMDAIGLPTYIEKKDSDGNPVAESSGGIRLVPWGQGYKDMTQAVEALEVSVLERKLVYDTEPCLTWNISNAMTISDSAGNRKLDKSAVRFRIDGAVALAMAVGLKSRDRKGAPRRSIFEDLTVDQRIQLMSIKRR